MLLFFLHCPQQVRLGESGNLDVVGIATEIVEVKADGSCAEGEFGGACLLAGRRIGAERDAAAEGCFEAVFENAIVDHIDQAAGGAAPVQQGRRAANDFNMFREHAVHAHGVVFTQRRGIQCIKTVG